MQVIHTKDTFQMRQEVANTDAKIQALHDECARMFKECSDKLEATGQDIISMKEHLNGHPPRDWHLKADQTIIDVQNRVNYLEHNMGSRATVGVSTKNRGLIPKKECRRTSLAERSGSSSGGRTSSISWMLSARRLQEQVGPLRRPAHEHGVQCRPGG